MTTSSRARPRTFTAMLVVLATMIGILSIAEPAQAVTGPPAPPLADPDTIAVPGTSNSYVTVGTTAIGIDGCGAPAWAVWYVPYIRHTGLSLTDRCLNGDAMPSGAGAWAEPGSDIWAPSIVSFGGKYHLYYTARKKGTGQRCIGRASSSSAHGPFTGQTEFACPGAGRWALDADTLVDGGKLYVTYRDDAVTTGDQTGISAVQAGSNGAAIWSTRRTLLLSTQVGWERSASTGTYVVENPSLFRSSNGNVYLFFSGNDWNSQQYAVGMANCGTSALPATTCSVLGNLNRPYYGYSARIGNGPQHTLPRDQKGPGGLAVFAKHGGGFAVVWHYWLGDNYRRLLNGTLSRQDAQTFVVS
jgi:hypothetical protein